MAAMHPAHLEDDADFARVRDYLTDLQGRICAAVETADGGARFVEDRWTRSEVGGLDASKFVAPTLVRYPTFDTVDGRPRTIPAFYYKPSKPAKAPPRKGRSSDDDEE